MELIELSTTTQRALEKHINIFWICKLFCRWGIVLDGLFWTIPHRVPWTKTGQINRIYCRYVQGKICRTTYQNLRKAAAMLQEFRLTGKITLERIPNWGRREVIPEQWFVLDDSTQGPMDEDWANQQNLLQHTASEVHNSCGLSESTVRHYTEEGLAVILKKHYDSGTESYPR